jgi:hypothetical protein
MSGPTFHMKLSMGFKPNSGIPPFILPIISLMEHVLSQSMGRDGLKRVSCQLKSAINFWWQSTKTLIGARVYQSCGLKKNGGEFSLQFNDTSHIRQGDEQATPTGPLSPKHSEDEPVTTTMQQTKSNT